MSASKTQDRSAVRIEHSLNQEEQDFVDRRRNTIPQNPQKLQIQCTPKKIPNIALLGSGGGERAMVALLGSLVQLGEAGLLDHVLYLSGVSGSTWCMAALYEEPDWSRKLETVKETIIQRLSGPAVSWKEAYDKLKKYYKEKDFITLTDVWAAIEVTTYVKKIDEHTLSDQWSQNSKDPYPIYTVIDKGCKQREEGDPWVEITPHEAGYSLTGAFVKTSSFGSQFDNGSKKKLQPQMDMLYLQGLCGSALADWCEIKKFLLEKIREFIEHIIGFQMFEDPTEGKGYEVLLKLAQMNLAFLNGEVTHDFDVSIRNLIKEIFKDKHEQLIFPIEKQHDKQYMNDYTKAVINCLRCKLDWPPALRMCSRMIDCVTDWIWGTTYDFLYNIAEPSVPLVLLESETRDYEDAGLLLNSPYFSVLRKERNIDFIISLDFSDGDPFLTLTKTVQMCKDIPFPEVHIPEEEHKKPKDFYVFKGQNVPTVIHIPLFNVINCGDQIEEKKEEYCTFQGPYSEKMIRDLIELAGKNISNNKEKLKKEIFNPTGEETHK